MEAACRADGPERVGFEISFGSERTSLRLVPAFVLPGESMPITARGAGRYQARSDSGSLTATGFGGWTWQAPDESGEACIELRDATAGQVAGIRVFVLTPWDGSPILNGYRLGHYEREPLRGDPAYERPRGFVEVTQRNEHMPISPHFTLGEFLCKQESGWPKYMALRTRLIVKLERLVDELRRDGISPGRLHIMSGYRTPAYNRAIGNRTSYSRHLYGDAADVFVDDDHDALMDDIDRDGRITIGDARLLYDLTERRLADASFAGGLGLYGPARHRGPFVHVDTRGHPARW